MSKGIILTLDEINSTEVISIINPIPLGLLDPRSPMISPELKKKILYEKYKKRFIADALETGHLVLKGKGVLGFISKQSVQSFAGFVFEAYLVDKFNENWTSRLTAYQWATERSSGWSITNFEDYIAVGTGLLHTKTHYINHYEPQSNADIIFIRKSPKCDVMENALVHNQQIPAKIQVKSIKTRYKEEVIDPIRSGKYQRVITMLSDPDGESSWKKCHTILSNMKRNRTITPEEHSKLIERIQGPEFFSISQNDVDDYYEFIFNWYNSKTKETSKYTDMAAWQEISQCKYQDGLLVPL
ncbi:hypothetical protein VAH18_003460 [Providencia rettgeri]|nr:hypothetical protein [Providencia rettgeri]